MIDEMVRSLGADLFRWGGVLCLLIAVLISVLAGRCEKRKHDDPDDPSCVS